MGGEDIFIIEKVELKIKMKFLEEFILKEWLIFSSYCSYENVEEDV